MNLSLPPNFTEQFLGFLLAFVVGTTFARYCQAFVAYRLGDRLPRSEGRLSIRPGRHVDALGVLLAIIVAFIPGRAISWGKPLNLNPYGNRLKRPGEALIAFVGPLAYFVLAAVSRFFLGLAFDLSHITITNFSFVLLGYSFIIGNLFYAAFSLLPLPPLDGWRILKGIWPTTWDTKVVWVETYGTAIVLLVTFILPGFGLNLLNQFFFSPIVSGLASLINLPYNF